MKDKETPQQELDRTILRVRDLVAAVFGRETYRLTIDFQATDEVPYRAHVPDEVVPLAGLARKGS